MEQQTYRGPQVPFWEIRGGSTDHPTADTKAQPPSVALVGSAVAWGRPTREAERNKKRSHWVLGRQAASLEERKEKSARGGTRKQRGGRDSPAGKRIKDIRQFFEAKGGSSGPSLESDRNGGEGSRTQ